MINLGTCGGIRGCQRGSIILVEQTLVYDLGVQIGEIAEAVSQYTTILDLSWLATNYPQTVHRTLLISGDRDLIAGEVADLRAQYGAVALTGNGLQLPMWRIQEQHPLPDPSWCHRLGRT